MSYFDHLRHIPIDKESNYIDTRDGDYDFFVESEHWAQAKTQAVRITFDEFSHYMDENGMEKAIFIISAMFYSIDKDELFDDLVIEFLNDADDLKTGDYDDLFSVEDAKLLHADIAKIIKYIREHPKFKKLI